MLPHQPPNNSKLFLFSCSRTCDVCMCACLHVCGCGYTCRWRLLAYTSNHSLLLFCLTQGGRVSLSNPELTDVLGLTGLPKMEFQGGCSGHVYTLPSPEHNLLKKNYRTGELVQTLRELTVLQRIWVQSPHLHGGLQPPVTPVPGDSNTLF